MLTTSPFPIPQSPVPNTHSPFPIPHMAAFVQFYQRGQRGFSRAFKPD
uniref:Uncharacterized protein n=1 Tax=uncultured bacterium contig00061 TaxID=1181544 RepID=A0A806JYY2_9BACT|nr:hypothetical protein [uncultured bacterium contig00061]